MSVTLSQVQSAYLDNADYRADASVAKAQLFVTACTRLLAFPQSAGKGTANNSFDLKLIKEQLEEARQFIVRKSNSRSTVAHPNFRGFRD